MKSTHSAPMKLLFAGLLLITEPLLAANFPPALLEKPDAWYGSEEGRITTASVLSWQTKDGIWPKAVDTARTMNPAPLTKGDGTFDNHSTTDELRYLARAYRATNDEACKKAFLKGFDLILKAQYPSGGWPQSFPLEKKGYPARITFNDGSMVRLLRFLREVATHEIFSFVDASRRTAASTAVDLGVDCVIKCQIMSRGTLTVWCAQHDEATLVPAIGRAFELPSLSGYESADVVRFLMSLEKPTPEVIRSVKAAVAWFESSKITGIRVAEINGDRTVIEDKHAPPLWARFYDLETGRPFFCDRDGIMKPQLAEIGTERRNGYAWYGSWGESVASEYAKWPHR
jgi:PelA/Pel-15E family pectate lyase